MNVWVLYKPAAQEPIVGVYASAEGATEAQRLAADSAGAEAYEIHEAPVWTLQVGAVVRLPS